MGSTSISIHASDDAKPQVFFLGETGRFSVSINDPNGINVSFFINRGQLNAMRDALDIYAAEQDGTRDA